MRQMVPSERFNEIDKALKGAYVDIETFDVIISPSNVIQLDNGAIASTGYTPPSEDTIQILTLPFDFEDVQTWDDYFNVLKAGFTLYKWPTEENEQVIVFGQNPNIQHPITFKMIYIYKSTL